MQFLQQYWWCIVALLGALLVMLMFVQGGQTFIFQLAKGNDKHKGLIINTFGRKWEFTFTTLVTFGGAFFASFPKFYSVSFGGATYVWLLILFTMIVQAVAYEFRNKENNILGSRTYDCFLTLNGFIAPLLLGIAVGTFFFGANFSFRLFNLTYYDAKFSMLSWDSPWRGLEAVCDPRNLLLGFSVLMLARVLGLLYIINSVDDSELIQNCRKSLRINSILFLVFFLPFVVCMLMASGASEIYYSTQEDVLGTSIILQRDNVYLNNFLSLPLVSAFFLIGVALVLTGMIKGIFTDSIKGIWFSGIGTILVVFSLFIVVAWNGVSYYHSLSAPESSLTITNSSASMETLKIMTYVSWFIPIVLAYIFWAWRKINSTRINIQEISDSDSY